jgi:hypothetical protein
LLEQAKAFEPKFWAYDIARARSLLPRWYGEPGDWEAYAEQAAGRPDGLGAEIYARIVMDLHGYYDNVFRETKASWLKVRQGLSEMRQKYPRSFDLLNQTALLSTLGGDRELAKETFGKLGDSYLPSVWGKPERLSAPESGPRPAYNNGAIIQFLLDLDSILSGEHTRLACWFRRPAETIFEILDFFSG